MLNLPCYKVYNLYAELYNCFMNKDANKPIFFNIGAERSDERNEATKCKTEHFCKRGKAQKRAYGKKQTVPKDGA